MPVAEEVEAVAEAIEEVAVEVLASEEAVVQAEVAAAEEVSRSSDEYGSCHIGAYLPTT